MGDGKRYHRKGSEHGSARWGSKAEKDIIADTNDFYNNVICASDIMLVLDRKKRDKNEAESGKKKSDKKGKKPKIAKNISKISSPVCSKTASFIVIIVRNTSYDILRTEKPNDREINKNKQKYYYYEAMESGDFNMLIWYSNEYIYGIDAQLDEDEIIKIAENIKSAK